MGLNISGGVTFSGGITLSAPASSSQLREAPDDISVGSSSTTSYLEDVRDYYDDLAFRPDFYEDDYEPADDVGGITDIFYLSGPKRYYAIMFHGGGNHTYKGTTSNYSIQAILARDGWGSNTGVNLSSNSLSYMPSSGPIWSSALAYPTNAQPYNDPDIENPDAPIEGWTCVFLESAHRYNNANILNFTKYPHGASTSFRYRRG